MTKRKVRIRLIAKDQKTPHAPLFVTRITADGQLLGNMYGGILSRATAVKILRIARKSYKNFSIEVVKSGYYQDEGKL